MSTRPLRVLLTNDDGPPSDRNGPSPFVYGFALALKRQLGWSVSVVVPSSQKSWVGKSFQIQQTTTGHFYYPRGIDGTEGEHSDLPRELKEGEEMEWILIDGTPATCANLGIHSLFPPKTFDLVLSGPNLGRNTSTAFALSSGTIGAALSGALSEFPAIAVSFGLMAPYKGDLLTPEIVNAGMREACKVVKQLYEIGFGSGEDKVDVYSVNVPLVPEIVQESNCVVSWTTMARTNYGRLFKSSEKAVKVDPAGPAAIVEERDETVQVKVAEDLEVIVEHRSKPLSFVFAPDVSSLINPSGDTIARGTDTHALHKNYISVTPLRAAFAEAKMPTQIPLDGLKWINGRL